MRCFLREKVSWFMAPILPHQISFVRTHTRIYIHRCTCKAGASMEAEHFKSVHIKWVLDVVGGRHAIMHIPRVVCLLCRLIYSSWFGCCRWCRRHCNIFIRHSTSATGGGDTWAKSTRQCSYITCSWSAVFLAKSFKNDVLLQNTPQSQNSPPWMLFSSS